MDRIAREHAAINVEVARDREEAARLLSARRSALSALARIRPTTILEDVTGHDGAMIDMNATFLELGVDSLMMTQAHARFQQEFEVPLSLKDYFGSTPTLSALADYIALHSASKDSDLGNLAQRPLDIRVRYILYIDHSKNQG